MPKSKTKLFTFLEELSKKDSDFKHLLEINKLGLKHKMVTDETYGRDSHIYIMSGPNTTMSKSPQRRKLEALLKENGFTVNDDYFPGSAIVDVKVSYFKGWHWDE